MSRVELHDLIRYFDGHFPGHPVFPGVAQFSLVLDEIRRLHGETLSFTGIPRFRFRRPLGLNESVDVSVSAIEQESKVEHRSYRFALASGQDTVCDGIIRVTSPEARNPPIPERSHPLISGIFESLTAERPASGAALIPHSPPARLAGTICSASQDAMTCAIIIPPDSPFVSDGWTPVHLGIEAAAQSAAMHEGLLRASSETATPGPRIGYLVSGRDIQASVPALPMKTDLCAEIRVITRMPPLMLYSFRLGPFAANGSLSEEWIGGSIGTYIDGPKAEGPPSDAGPGSTP